MSNLFNKGERLRTDTSNCECEVMQYLGGGGQGEVFRVKVKNTEYAMKWYYQHTATQDQKKILETLIKKGSPSHKFLWPIEFVGSDDMPGFGYIMPLRNSKYKSITDLMRNKVDTSFKALSTAGFELANSFRLLHSAGLCYSDISFGNVFFDPKTGSILICDNDNVTFDKTFSGGVLGTPRFMAPEIVMGKSLPNSQSDLFSLAVLLFYMFMIHHPLEGKKETEIKCFDLPAMNKLYGTNAIFIWHPKNTTNRPVPGIQDNAIKFWPIYPKFIKDLFIRSFVDGIKDPDNGRVRESEWQQGLIKLSDSIIYCPNCGSENFYDEAAIEKNKKLKPCWNCKNDILLPFRIQINKNIIMLNHDKKLYLHHFDGQYDFTTTLAEVTQHPTDKNIWGLKNLSSNKWVVNKPDGKQLEVLEGQSVSLIPGIKIFFGKCEGEIKY